MRMMHLETSMQEPLAQSVEQQPFKLWVVGSNPTRLTSLRSIELRLAAPTLFRCNISKSTSPSSSRSRTPDFHSGNRGSNPLGDANLRSKSYGWQANFLKRITLLEK